MKCYVQLSVNLRSVPRMCLDAQVVVLLTGTGIIAPSSSHVAEISNIFH